MSLPYMMDIPVSFVQPIQEQNATIVKGIQDNFQPTIEKIRRDYFNKNKKDQAITEFTNYILNLCYELGLRKNYVISLPSQIDETMPMAQQIDLIESATSLLTNKYNKIMPTPPVHKQITEALFYNFTTTKILPPVIKLSGFALAGAWWIHNFKTYRRNAIEHPHKRILWQYIPTKHGEKATTSSKIRQVFSLVNMAEDFQSNSSPTIESFLGETNSDNKEKTTEKSIDSCSKKDFVLGWDICNQEEHTVETVFGKSAPLPQCKKGECDQCYVFNGLKPSYSIAAHTAWSLRPALLIPIAWILGNWIRDAQKHTYENRIKTKKEQAESEKARADILKNKVQYEKRIGFDQIKGKDKLIHEEMMPLVDYLKHPFRYKNLSSGARSILMYGPPGNGKTLIARAIAKESGAPFLEITADDIMSDNAKEKITTIMSMAEEIAATRQEKSAIIYIDEIDCVTGDRTQGNLDHQRARALSNLLSIFDGIEERNPYIHLVIIITTNHHQKLDPALLRPGRIDKKFLIGKPDTEGRTHFFTDLLPQEQIHLVDWLSKETDGFSGAQIVHLIDTAVQITAYNGSNITGEQEYKQALTACLEEL